MKKTMWLVATVLALGVMLQLSAPVWTAERHPEIRAAMRALTNAENHLRRAAHDYGGHRVKAMELITQAQNELKEGLEYDRTHEQGGKGTSTTPQPGAPK